MKRFACVGGRRAGLGILLAFTLVGVAAPSAAAQAKPGPAKPDAHENSVTFGVQPASAPKPKAGIKPDTRPLLSYGVTPNGLLNDHVAFRNYSKAPISVRIYATDSLATTNGDFSLIPSRQKPVDVGSWVTLLGVPGGVIVVPPQSFKIVPMRLKVPADAQPGDHTGAVIASYDTVGKNKEGAIVRLEQRVGTRLRVRVTGPLRPKLLVDGLTATYERPGNPFGKGLVRIKYKVSNVGNVRLSGRQSVSVKGWFGANAAAQGLADIPELLPRSSVEVSTTVAMLPVGKLRVTAEVAPVTPSGDASLPLTTVRQTASLWALTWAWILALLVVAAIVALLWYRLRRRANRRPVESSASRIADTPVNVSAATAGVDE